MRAAARGTNHKLLRHPYSWLLPTQYEAARTAFMVGMAHLLSPLKVTQWLKSVFLVIGGWGFIGFHVVKALLKERTWPSVLIMSRHPARNQLAGAFYHAGGMTRRNRYGRSLARFGPVPSSTPPLLSPLETRRTGSISTGPVLEGPRMFLNVRPPAPTSKHSYIFLPCQSSRIPLSITLMRLRRWLRVHLSSTTVQNPRPWPTSMRQIRIVKRVSKPPVFASQAFTVHVTIK